MILFSVLVVIIKYCILFMIIILLLYMDHNHQSFKNLLEKYEKLTYLDNYGNSIFFLIFISIILFLIISYCFVMIYSQSIKDDWNNQRCKPYVMPFASFINKPDNMNFTDFTKQNFDYCIQNILTTVGGDAVQPITFVVNMLNNIANSISEAINAIRGMVNKIRLMIQYVTEEVMGRLMNIMIPIQVMIISFRDLMGKIQGTMTAGLFTLLGSYYTLQSLFGAIAQMIITILISLGVLIAGLWLVPVTWGMAISFSLIFVAIAVPMAIILAFMMEFLHVQPSPGIPQLPTCFDQNTKIKMENGFEKPILDICVGEKLYDGSMITSKLKLATGNSIMYLLNNVYVSGSHKVKYNGQWCNVSEHPDSKKIAFYNEPYLYSLNTSSKQIQIGDMMFADWDDLYKEEDQNKIKNEILKILLKSGAKTIKHIQNHHIHSYIDGGFSGDTKIKLKNSVVKEIKNVQIGDVLEKGEIVYGFVEIDGKQLKNQSFYYLGKNTFISGPNLNFCDKKYGFINILDLDENIQIRKEAVQIKEDKLYHLLTNQKKFTINKLKVYDYDACIEYFLEK